MTQGNIPTRLLDEFFAEVRRPAAGFNADTLNETQGPQEASHFLAIVADRAVQKNFALLVKHTHLNGILVVVQADKKGYIAHDPLLLDETLAS
jgi:hypothetical protein